MSSLTSKQNSSWIEFGRDLQTANLSNISFSECIVYVYDSSAYAIAFHFNNAAPSRVYYSGSNTSGFIGGSINWNDTTKTFSSPSLVISGTASTGAGMMIVYR